MIESFQICHSDKNPLRFINVEIEKSVSKFLTIRFTTIIKSYGKI